MHLAAPDTELPSQAAFTRFDDGHSEASDPAGAAGLPGIRRRAEAPTAETPPHIHITPRVIGERGNLSEQMSWFAATASMTFSRAGGTRRE